MSNIIIERASEMLKAIVAHADKTVCNTGELVERKASLVLNSIEKVQLFLEINK